jgi:hypothetical protein
MRKMNLKNTRNIKLRVYLNLGSFVIYKLYNLNNDNNVWIFILFQSKALTLAKLSSLILYSCEFIRLN